MGGTSTNSAKATKSASQPAQNNEIMCVSACFARSRGWVAGSPNLCTRDNAGEFDCDCNQQFPRQYTGIGSNNDNRYKTS